MVASIFLKNILSIGTLLVIRIQFFIIPNTYCL
jgi:hypothetical protein